jgi:hypothetical protein
MRLTVVRSVEFPSGQSPLFKLLCRLFVTEQELHTIDLFYDGQAFSDYVEDVHDIVNQPWLFVDHDVFVVQDAEAAIKEACEALMGYLRAAQHFKGKEEYEFDS